MIEAWGAVEKGHFDLYRRSEVEVLWTSSQTDLTQEVRVAVFLGIASDPVRSRNLPKREALRTDFEY